MPHSWSGIRKRLEQDLLCDSLQGRVKYFTTIYRESHDEALSRFAVLVDNNQIISSNSYYWDDNTVDDINQGKFSTYEFTSALDFYLHNPIEKCINSDNGMIRLFAVLDRRVGKRTLTKLLDTLDDQPDWLKPFYTLRFEAEGLT